MKGSTVVELLGLGAMVCLVAFALIANAAAKPLDHGDIWVMPTFAMFLYVLMTALWTARMSGWNFKFDGATDLAVGEEFTRHIAAMAKLFITLALAWQEWVVVKAAQGIHYPVLLHDVGVVSTIIFIFTVSYGLVLRTRLRHKIRDASASR